MKNKIALVCDANFATLPVVFALKQLGYRVACCGALASDPCHAIADLSFLIDYSDKNALLALVCELKPDCLISGCNDVSYLSAAWVAQQQGYPGFDRYDTAQVIHEKVLFRKLCQHKNYPSPGSANSVAQAINLTFPVIVKPTASFSGKGIQKFQTEDALTDFFESNFVHSEDYVIEEFVNGKLFSHSAFIKDGSIVVDFFVNEYCTVYPYQVNSSHLSTDLSEQVKLQARNWLVQFAQDLSLVDGLVHTQFLSDGSSFVILEVCRRSPGDLYSLLIQKSTGLDYARLFADGFLKQLPAEVTHRIKPHFITRHTVSVDYDCIFLGASLKLDCVDMVNYQLKKSGEKMKAAPYDKSGIYFIEHYSEDEMLEHAENMRYFVNVDCVRIEEPL
tara:strand:- start:4392 stop:5561 length:1170 start_codon:yes stop_codon:yes gene_type:complete